MNFSKKHWFVLVFIFAIAGVIIHHEFFKTKEPNLKPNSSDNTSNLDIPTKEKIKEQIAKIKNLETQFLALKEEYQIKKNNLDERYDSFKLKQLELNLNYLSNDLFGLCGLKHTFNNLGINIFVDGTPFSQSLFNDQVKKLAEQNFDEDKINQAQETLNKLKYKVKKIIPKIKTSSETFNKIKDYIFSENKDAVLKLILSEEEKNEINEIKKHWEQRLGYLNEDQKNIAESQKTCDDLIAKRDSITNQISSLQQKQKEEKLASKKKEIKLTQKQIEEATNLTEQQKLRAKLDILDNEKIELVKQITEIKNQIGLLENDIEMFNNMLSNANKLKNSLQRDYDKELPYNKKSILSSLDILYEIIPSEG